VLGGRRTGGETRRGREGPGEGEIVGVGGGVR
jgi:hypothetical protein